MTSGIATFGGLASGLPVQDLIDATIAANSTRLNQYKEDKTTASGQQTAYNTVKAKFNSFDSTLQKVLDSRMIYAFDLFDRKKVDVSDNSVATVATSKGAMTGNIEVKVNKLATPPQITISDVGGPINADVNLYELGVIEENFSLAFQTPTGGVTISESIVSGDTLTSYVAKLNAKITEDETLEGSIAVSVDANGVATLDFSGVTGGTLNTSTPFANSRSNLADVLGLQIDGNNLVSDPKSKLNLDGKIADNSAGFRNFGVQTVPETINIGGIEIEITADTTLRQIMNEVNETSTAQVKMTYDTTSNSITFKAKDDFYSDSIYFSGNTLLTDLGLTDSAGVVDTSIQTQRQAGEIVVDGKTIAIKSNKVTAAETGLAGVTINLKSVTDSDEPLKISISQNTDDLTKALDNVAGAFNAIKKTIDGYTYVNIDTSDETSEMDKGVLANEYSITSMLTTLQMKLMSPAENDKLSYKALALVGFSTEEGELKFDKTKFLNALSDNSEDVKKLLIGDKEDGTKGVLGSVQDILKQYTDIEAGFFTTKANSLTESIKNLNKSIMAEESRLEQQRTRLVKQYSDLDSLVSKYQTQMTALSNF